MSSHLLVRDVPGNAAEYEGELTLDEQAALYYPHDDDDGEDSDDEEVM